MATRGEKMTNEEERVPPYSEEAERAVLGSVLIDDHPARIFGLMTQARIAAPEAFYSRAHQVIFGAMQEMLAAGRPPDLLTLRQWLTDRGKLEDVGGALFLENLVDQLPTSAMAEYYIKIVREKFMRRRMIGWAYGILGDCRKAEEDEQTILARHLAEGQAIGNDLLTESRSNADVLETLIQNWENAALLRKGDEEHVPGLKTPFKRLNQVLGGIQPGMHFWGGKSSSGKTAMAINIIDWFAHQGHPGLLIQLDDTHEDAIGRIVAMRTRLSLPYLSQGFARHEQLERVKEEMRPLMAKLPIFIVEECPDVLEVRALAKFYQFKHKIEWLVVDYVQVLDADGNPRDDERQRLGKIAKHLKRLWKELRIPVIVVSQTSKFKDADDNGRAADMSDLFGASELFHAATSVTIIKRVTDVPEQGVPQTGDSYTKKIAVAVHVTKNKHGPKDQMVYFWMTPKYFMFDETDWIKEGTTNAHQATWEEDIERNTGKLIETGRDFRGKK